MIRSGRRSGALSKAGEQLGRLKEIVPFEVFRSRLKARSSEATGRAAGVRHMVAYGCLSCRRFGIPLQHG